MLSRPWTTRWIPPLAVTAVCIASLAAAIFGASERQSPAHAGRPAADAPVQVVRSPASATHRRDPACPACTHDAGRDWL